MRFAGTYDQAWTDNRAPYLPDDFDYRYFQSAPVDQQLRYPSGGEEVALYQLTPDGQRGFRLPTKKMPVLFGFHRGEDRAQDAVVDTIVFEPDLERFTLTWRTCLPLQQDRFEIKEVIAGEMPHAWYSQRRAKAKGKVYYRSLAELVAAKRGRR